MSVRQYIGARYVTKVYENSLDPSSAEWESGRAYEPLTLVTYLNSSYLSKKEVPASIGDPASNPIYWVVTGAYNGQIATLQSQVTYLTEIVNSININTKNFWCIGDSFLGLSRNWGYFIDRWTDKTSFKTFEGGAGFNKPGNNTGKTIPQLIADAVVPDGITDVILYAGCNDCDLSYYNVSSAFGDAIANIKAKVPNAKIWVSFNGTYLDRNNSYVGDVYTKMTVSAAPSEATFIPAAWYSIQNKNLTVDDIHPTEDGSIRIAIAMLNSIYGGCDICYPKVDTLNGIKFITCASNYITCSLGFLNAIYNDNDNPISLTRNHNYLLSGPNTAPVCARYNYQIAFTAYCQVIDGGTTKYGLFTFHVDTAGQLNIIPLEDNYSSVTKITSYSAVNTSIPYAVALH